MDEPKITRTVTVVNRAGLHARAALSLAKLVRGLEAKVELVVDGQRAEATDLLQVLSLGAVQGRQVVLECAGPNADAVLNTVEDLFAQKFHEGE
jgi:phosphotransferase system HPr (HPr) family protein